jgi:hypothetical protein
MKPYLVPSITITYDAPSCGITYDHYSDESRGINYDRNVFVVQSTGSHTRK